MTKDLYDKEIKWKNCLLHNRCPILDLNNGLFTEKEQKNAYMYTCMMGLWTGIA